MAPPERIELRELTDADIPSLLACQRAAFGERAKTEAQLAWAAGPPGLPRRAVVALRGERVVAACTGVPARTWLGGEERVCVQHVDLMVHPEERAGLAGGRLYREVAGAFLERYGVQGTDAVHYGWPIPAAQRLGERFLEYAFVREELVLVRPVAAVLTPPPSAVEVQHEFGDDLRWLWDRCATSFGAATIRDAAWAEWRFLRRPGVDYLALGVRREGHLRGLAVLRTNAWDWEGVLPLVDWLVPADEPEIAAQLDAAVARAARAAGAERVVTLVPPTHATFDELQALGWRAQPSPYTLLMRSFVPGIDADDWREQAWLTLADTDLA